MSTASIGVCVAALIPLAAGAQEQSVAGSSTAGTEGLQEIVVTATRQAEAISKVPISISAFSQQDMEAKGVKSFEDLARYTPGVSFSNGAGGGNANTITIRGISSGAGSGTTGIYLNDTPIQMRALGFSADDSLPFIFDLDRIEILRGPQGTLFGAGSEGGTVRYITVQPSLTKYSGTARSEISTTRYGDLSYEGGGAFGGPIVQDAIGFRVSAWYRRDGGYIDRIDTSTGDTVDKNANHSQSTSLQAALTFQPVTGLTITPSVLYQKHDVNDVSTYFTSISDPGQGRFLNGSPDRRNSNDRFTLPALLVRLDLGRVSLISNTSYFKRDNLTGYDGTLYDLSYYQGSSFLSSDDCLSGAATCRTDLYPLLTPTGVNPAVSFYKSPSVVTNTQRNLTEELRAQSSDPDSRLNWVTGVFFQRSRQQSTEELVDPLGNQLFSFLFDGTSLEDYTGYPLYRNGSNIDSYINHTGATDRQTALFADVSYKVTDQLKLTAGGRYAWTNYDFANFADGSQNFARTENVGKTSEHPFTPKAGASYQFDDNNLLYVSYAKGFRAGGANPPVPYDACKADLDQLGLTKSPDSYKSDSVKSWEIGSKNSLFDHRLSLAASAYDITWSGIQSAVYLNSCAIQFTGNLGEATSRGFDFQAEVRPLPGVTLEGTLAYTNAYYTRATVAGDSNIVSKGDGLGIPPWTFTLGAEKSFTLFTYSGYARLDYEHTNKVNRLDETRDPANQSYDPALVEPPATNFVSLRTGILLGNANVSLFADNLFNSLPQLTYTHQSRETLLYQSSTQRPRTVGLTVIYNWH